MATPDQSRARRAGRGSRSIPTTIVEVMTAPPHTIDSEARLVHAHDLMRRHELRHLPVLHGARLVGVLSQRDLYLFESLGGARGRVDKVSAAMAAAVYSVAPDDRLVDVLRTMVEQKYGCAVVVDRGHVVGIFTAGDALRLLAEAIS
jgi:acetoin utilization protein AcuB